MPFDNQAKNSSVFANEGNSDVANLWASSVFPWQLSLPWQYDTSVIDRIFDALSKNLATFNNQAKN